MKLDAPMPGTPLAGAAEAARAAEAAGFDGVFTFDGPYDPFPALALATAAADVDIATGVAIALARSPMTTAQVAHDLQDLSGGRFRLGLGSQVRAHVERRFSMPWSRPVARMKEFVGALRAIFACWNDDEPLRFEGEFYRHTLMPPLLRPPACRYGAPPILLAAVGPPMLEAAGEVADGCVIHPFHSRRYLDEVALPALERGRRRRAQGGTAAPGPFEVTVQVLATTGATTAERDAVREAVRAQLAFYASTPAYRPVLDVDGRGDLQGELRELTRRGRWADMAACVDDAMLERHAVAGDPFEVGRLLRRRYDGIASRVAIATPFALSDECSRAVVRGFRDGD